METTTSNNAEAAGWHLRYVTLGYCLAMGDAHPVELGGVAPSFKQPESRCRAREKGNVHGALRPPTLDGALDTLLAANKGRTLGPDSILFGTESSWLAARC